MNKINAIVLSGGFSSRMGMDKGLVPFNGSSMIERSIKLASKVTDSIMIIANTTGYEQFGYPVYADILKEKGPIGGIHTGLSHSNTQFNLVLACDMPLMSAELLKHLIDEISDDHHMVVPKHKEQLEPLCAIYSKDCLSKLEQAAKSSELSLNAFIRSALTKIIDVDASLPYYSPYLFSNANTKEDLANLELIEK